MSLLERGAKPYMRGLSPVIVEDGDGEERGRARRRTRGGKTVTWSKTLLQVRSISPRPPRQAASPRPAPRSPSPSSFQLDPSSSACWSSSPPSPMRSPSPPATAMLTSSGSAPPPFRWQVPLNNMEAHQVHQHQQLLQPKSLNLNIDVQQVAQISDEVGGQVQESERGGGQSKSELGQWRSIPITRLDLSLDLTGRDLQNMDVS